MTFPTTSGRLPQAQLQEARPRALEASLAQTQSRELDVFVAEIPNYGTPVAKNDLPVAKSWAHFVAGGYATLFSLTSRADSMKPWRDSFSGHDCTTGCYQNSSPVRFLSKPNCGLTTGSRNHFGQDSFAAAKCHITIQGDIPNTLFHRPCRGSASSV